MGRWSLEDDAKLARLFREKTIDYSKTDTASIKAAIKHFPGAKYENFAPLFKAKCAKWNLGETLSGKRRGPASEFALHSTPLPLLFSLTHIICCF